jgi:hypothetical protein
MRVVRTLQDAEFLIGDLMSRIEALENAVKPKVTERIVETAATSVDNEALDINYSSDANTIFHKLKHIFKSKVEFEDLITIFNDLKLSANIPELILEQNTGTPAVIKIRIFASPTPTLALTNNLSYNGTNWNLDDTGSGGSLLTIRVADFEYFVATAGANPRSLTTVFKVTSGNRVYVNNVAILNTQQSDPGAAPSSPTITTLGIGGTAGAIYTGVEQALINNLLTNNGNLNTDVANIDIAIDALIVCVDNIRTALRNHGLCA